MSAFKILVVAWLSPFGSALSAPSTQRTLDRRRLLQTTLTFLPFVAQGAEFSGENGLVFVPVEGDVASAPSAVIQQVEGTYGKDFACYLSRVLLSYDTACQRWWTAQTKRCRNKAELDQALEAFTDSTKLSLARTWLTNPGDLLKALKDRQEFLSSILASRQLTAAFALILPPFQPSSELESLIAETENRTVVNATLLRDLPIIEPGTLFENGTLPSMTSTSITFDKPAFASKSPATGTLFLEAVYDDDDDDDLITGYRAAKVVIDSAGSGYSKAIQGDQVDGRAFGIIVARAGLSEAVYKGAKPRSAVYAVNLDVKGDDQVFDVQNARTLLLPLNGTSIERRGRAFAFPAFTRDPELEGEAMLPRLFEPVEIDARPSPSQFLTIALCGALCASASHAVLTPIEVAKTKLQVTGNDWDEAKARIQRGIDDFGPATTLFAGGDAVVLGYFLSGAAGFGLTAFFKTLLVAQDKFADVPTQDFSLDPALAVVVAALGASVFSTIVVAPFEAARVRAMAYDPAEDDKSFFRRRQEPTEPPPSLLASWEAAIEEKKGNIFDALFGSLNTLLVKDIVFAVVKFGAFDAVSDFLYATQPTWKESITTSLAVSLAAGTLAGIGGAIVSQPLDAAFTRLETSDDDDSLISALAAVYKDKGVVNGLYAGLLPRALFAGTLIALEFVIFEALKRGLHVSISDFEFTLDVLAGATKVLPPPSPLN